MSLLDDIRKDRDAGTDGPWFVEAGVSKWSSGISGMNGHAVVWASPSPDEGIQNDADAPRIARVPQMEAALLAADELAKRMAVLKDEAWGYDHLYETAFHAHVHEEIEAALKAYRAAIEAP